MDRAKTRLKWGLQTHANFAECDGLNLHKAPTCSGPASFQIKLAYRFPDGCVTAPKHVRWRSQKHDSKTNRRSHRLRCNRVCHQRQRGNDESGRSEWIARNSVWPRDVRKTFSV